MSWLLAIVLAVAVVYALKVLLFGLQQISVGGVASRHDFGNAIKHLVVIYENGSSLKVKHRESGMRLRIIRASGDDDSATIVLEVPNIAMTHAVQIDELSKSHGLDVRTTGDNESSRRVFIAIPDVWDEACGAAGARVIHMVLDSLSVSKSGTFKFRYSGFHSARAMRHRRGLGKR